jgi:PhoPQ-activated pathogenicity-related protein
VNIDTDYSIFKTRRKFGSIKAAADHFSVDSALIYMILRGERGQKMSGTKSHKILEQLVADDLIVFKDTSAHN